MDKQQSLKGPEKRKLLITLAAGGLLVILLALVAVRLPWSSYPLPPATRQARPENGLEPQAAALLPGFREDLSKLGNVPQYHIKAEINPQDGNLSGEMNLIYTNTQEGPVSELVFRLYPNAKWVYGGGSLTVTQVTQSGNPVQVHFSEDGTTLRAPLSPVLQPSEATEIDMTFQDQVPAGTAGGYGIFSRTHGVLFLAGWYPVLAVYDHGWQTPDIPVVGDALQADTSLYQVTLTLPKGYELASTGTVVKQETELPTPGIGTSEARASPNPSSVHNKTSQANGNEQVTWQIVSGPVREFALAASKNFKILESQAGQVRLRYFTLPAENPITSPDKGLDMLTRIFQAYQELYGPYPFREFDLVEASINIGGYEFSGMSSVDDALRARDNLADYRYLMAHEVAHQWWYGLVGTPTVTEPWLDEGHATYSAVLYLQHVGEVNSAEALLANWRHDYGERKPGKPPVNSPALEFTNWAEYRKSVYIHGALFLDQLRQELGDEKFFKLEKRFQETYRYQRATTQDYLDMAEEIAGRNLDELYLKWFDLPRTHSKS